MIDRGLVVNAEPCESSAEAGALSFNAFLKDDCVKPLDLVLQLGVAEPAVQQDNGYEG